MKFLLVLVFVYSVCVTPLLANSNRAPFIPSSSVAETLEQHLRVPNPADEVWWIPKGRDMLWNNKNIHQLFPTVNIYRNGPVKPLSYKLNNQIDNFKIKTPQGKLAFVDFLKSDLSSNMAIVILHKGDIVFEHYARMQEYEKPIWWSVTKVFASTLIAILEDRGQIDINKPVDFYLPELKGSDFRGVTVRNVLDMASGVDCSDGTYARGTCYYEYEASLNDAVRSNNTASTPYEALTNMKPGRWADQGVGFDYSGANTFVLSWIVERLMAMPFQDAVTKELWQKMGAEGDASIFAARYGIALSSGGLLAKARDMARFGLLFTPSYKKVSSEKVISDRYLDMIINKGRPELLANARFAGERSANPEIKHNSYQWDVVYNNNDFYKGGWAGQGLLINHEKDLVAVYLGYIKEDGSELAVLPRLRELLKTIYPK
ncbi:MAG: CubicO group peptidase (beta-lactamase class C family) [Kiritimatiellia bacterium]|jgi:CubicO group peptidase (beta-lactamase class C family)|tara:strand:+ start:295 stop:1587 length:1293 start_codon:yes stop_codon:yes gene_type:complete